MNGAQRGMVSSLLGAAFWLSVAVAVISFVGGVDWDGMVTTEAERAEAARVHRIEEEQRKALGLASFEFSDFEAFEERTGTHISTPFRAKSPAIQIIENLGEGLALPFVWGAGGLALVLGVLRRYRRLGSAEPPR